jgi:hypothetical protein
MKDVKHIHAEVLKTFSLINDLDSPEDSIYDMADMLAQFDGHTNQSWQETEQYKQWVKDPKKIIESWRNCSSYIIQLLEKSKTP